WLRRQLGPPRRQYNGGRYRCWTRDRDQTSGTPKGSLPAGFQGRSPRSPISREESLRGAAARGGSKTGSFAASHRLEGTLQGIEKHRLFFEVMAQEHADSLYVVGNEESWVYRRLIVELAEKNRLPAIYLFRDYVEAGGLLAYSHDEVELWTRTAGCIAQILN